MSYDRVKRLVEIFENIVRFSDESSGLSKENIQYMCMMARNCFPDLQRRIELHLNRNGFFKET